MNSDIHSLSCVKPVRRVTNGRWSRLPRVCLCDNKALAVASSVFVGGTTKDPETVSVFCRADVLKSSKSTLGLQLWPSQLWLQPLTFWPFKTSRWGPVDKLTNPAEPGKLEKSSKNLKCSLWVEELRTLLCQRKVFWFLAHQSVEQYMCSAPQEFFWDVWNFYQMIFKVLNLKVTYDSGWWLKEAIKCPRLHWFYPSLFFTMHSSCAASCSVIIQNNDGWPEKSLLSSVVATIMLQTLMFLPHVCRVQLQNNHLPAPGAPSLPCFPEPFLSSLFLFAGQCFLYWKWMNECLKEVKASPCLCSEELIHNLDTHIFKINRGSECVLGDLDSRRRGVIRSYADDAQLYIAVSADDS